MKLLPVRETILATQQNVITALNPLASVVEFSQLLIPIKYTAFVSLYVVLNVLASYSLEI